MSDYNIDVSKYYDISRILEYHRMVNMIVGGTGTGKTYAVKRYCMEQFLESGGERQFMFMRRTSTNFKDIANFFEPFKGPLEKDERFKDGWTVSKKDRCFMYDGKVCGYYRSLNEIKQKGCEFPSVYYIIFDEFITHGGYERYLPDEFNCFCGALDAVSRYIRDLTVFCTANAVSYYNPYFLEIGYTGDAGEFWAPTTPDGLGFANDTCVQKAVSNITTDLKNTRLGRLFHGTSYGSYALDNEALKDTKDFIKKKTKNCFLVLIFKTDNIDYGVWEDRATNEIFISKSVGNKNCIKFSAGGNDRAEGYATMRALKGLPVWAFITRQYDYGEVYYEDAQCKNAGIKFFKAGYNTT